MGPGNDVHADQLAHALSCRAARLRASGLGATAVLDPLAPDAAAQLRTLGGAGADPEDPAGFDLIYELSGAPAALNDAIAAAAFDGRIVVGSWYGAKPATLDLGRRFHRGRVRLISLGDYVLNGGEVAAMAMIEAIGRLVPGVVGNPESLVEESHEDGLLEYPSYTKPASWRGYDVPEVLLSGHHGRVAQWRHEQQLERTRERRPDLLA